MTEKQVIENIKLVLLKLYEYDQYLFEKSGSERSIAHCLANHLKSLFPQYDVDCEYNVNLDSDSGRKEIELLQDELEKFDRSTTNRRTVIIEDENYYSVSVYPDIIIHKRGRNDENFIVFELKKSDSKIDNSYDKCKLEKYTISHGLNYQYGIFVDINVGSPSTWRFEFTLFQNGSQIGGVHRL